MLDNLVESRNHRQENKKFGGFMLSTGIVLVAVLCVGFVFSLFNQNIVLASDSLEISTLVAPVPFETKPEIKSEPKPAPPETEPSGENKLPTRTDNVLRTDETPREVPNAVSVTPSNVKARPDSAFLIGKTNFDPVGGQSAAPKTGRGTVSGAVEGTGIKNDSRQVEETKKPEAEEPPPAIKKEVKRETMVSGGVINGKATNLVKPVYSAAAKNLGVKGVVKVQVVIDENGNVISASAVNGHALLKNSAVAAAKASKFSPTFLSDQKVKVTGFIVYNFT